MYLFYVDESGNLDRRTAIPGKNNTTIPGDPIYVLSAVCLFEQQWHGFEKTLNRHKNMLMDLIFKAHQIRLTLADCEVKSNWVRRPDERVNRPFLKNITDQELTALTDLFYQQLDYHNMTILSVIVDKPCLHDYMDQEKLHRKAWELLLELVEKFMASRHHKHQALMVKDDLTLQQNLSLAMKHAHIMDKGTANGIWLRHICEMPMFVRSELSNGVQLADMCSYNIYRSFKDAKLDYPFFERIASSIWSRSEPVAHPFSGLHVFPAHSQLHALVDEFETKRAASP
ncbi:DUF3800 domain-containing protein [Planctomicrobium piriforme]|uniref:DUF3800 domain-containing protein n=1 Tax=Planctomicrobium piriforme TaxID=1576369 RepID=A0A1I3B6M7_9PLAN|nr:DUF3800 domain-containing protein [Planctomicrobium piriforme]SFH57882.1 Protein of unknown function [Planctomicrobium piriforme]